MIISYRFLWSVIYKRRSPRKLCGLLIDLHVSDTCQRALNISEVRALLSLVKNWFNTEILFPVLWTPSAPCLWPHRRHLRLLPRDMLFQLPKQVIITWREIGAVGGMAQSVPFKGPRQILCDASCVRSRIVAQQADSSWQFVLNCSELLDVIFWGSHSMY